MLLGVKIICVDFFDTLMFRHIHSHQLMIQWEKCLKRKYVPLKEIDLCSLRKQAIKEMGGNECAISYELMIRNIYKKIDKYIGDCISENEFQMYSYIIDYNIDMATQYVNKTMIDTLKYLKEKQGKTICLVSDYYLPEKTYINYLKPYGLDKFFYKIFCSSDCNKTKYDGALYDEVLKILEVDAKDIIMIGDSKQSDNISPQLYGIEAYRYFPILHKMKTNIRKKVNYSYSKHVCKNIYTNTFKNCNFGDYALNLFYFTKNLVNDVKKKI